MTDYKVKHGDQVDEVQYEIGEDLGMTSIWGISLSFFFICLAISAWLVGIFGNHARLENEIKVMHSNSMTLLEVREEQMSRINTYALIDAAQARVSVPIDDAKRLAVRELTRLQRNPPVPTMLINGTDTKPFNPCNPCGATAAVENPCNPCEGEDSQVLGEPGTAHGVITQ